MRLIEEYRTTLTGLTPDETRALFIMSIPAPLTQRGIGASFKGNLLKLSLSMPDTRRARRHARASASILTPPGGFKRRESLIDFAEQIVGFYKTM